MKFNLILIVSILCINVSFSQDTTSATNKKKITTTDITAFMSYYTQDGKHSAVTGGQGTEKLQVYSNIFSIKVNTNQKRQFYADIGMDVISSASTDNIDFRVASASRTDYHVITNLGYSRFWEKKRLEIGGKGKLSAESDFFSKGIEVWTNYYTPSKMTSVGANFQVYFDDLRWGRFNSDIGKPDRLIYPVELRGTKWFDDYQRNSYNLAFSVRQDINRKMTVGFNPTFIYQNGLLSTPFHRIYFQGATLPKVEKLPDERYKAGLGFTLNTFIGNTLVLRTFYQYYTDNFGISAHTFSTSLPVKLSPKFAVYPHIRLYQQTAARYFKPYKMHQVSDEFYTSDFDLSGFQSINTGLGLDWAKGKGLFYDFSLRYSFYYRSDTLRAHIISSYFNFSKQKSRE